MARILSDGALDSFSANGFLSVDQIVPACEVAAIRRILEGLHEHRVGFAEGAQFDALAPEDKDEPSRFPQILHPRNFAPDLLKTRYYQVAQEMARQILGPRVRFKADISLLKPAFTGAATPWHQDEAFQDPSLEYAEVSFWLALQPVDRTNSCMEFLPGSHRWQVLEHGFPGGDPRIHALECIAPFDRSQAVPCVLPAGGCTIHTGRTLHYAGPNVSGAPRMAYVLIFDLAPRPASEARSFPWRAMHDTARSRRERYWRRHGGLFIHLWRQRSRMRLTYIVSDLRRAALALRQLRPHG